MTDPLRTQLLSELRERAKELECLYQVERQLTRLDQPLPEVLQAVAEVVPPGLQYPDVCVARIRYEDAEYSSKGFVATNWHIGADIVAQERVVGSFDVFYLEERPLEKDGPFLEAEKRLVKTIADRIGHFIFYQRLRRLHDRLERAESTKGTGDWRRAIHLLRDTDRNLYLRITRKLLNMLYGLGVEEARHLLGRSDATDDRDIASSESNIPGRVQRFDTDVLMTDRLYELAEQYLSVDDVFAIVQRWVYEEKASLLSKVLNNPRSSLPEIADALRRYRHMVPDPTALLPSTLNGIRVSLSRRFLTEQLDFLRVAKEYTEIEDFVQLLESTVMVSDSHGKLGGKASGLLLAERILHHDADESRPIGTFKTPKTWYIVSDAQLDFIAYNELDDVIEQKYKTIDEVRQDYPNIIQLFKNSSFPPELAKGLAAVLDDFDEVPLIVRSSSLLEDRLGTAFSGKYKSLFLANQGTKRRRLEALFDAIAEIYASVFGPDPIGYRRAHELLDFNEEMALLVQEVVGTRVGKYYLPAFGGVAFSNNEFRWSPRIRREDGIVRLVPGLGTRAVDRVADDYPVMAAPGQPNLRVNVALEEVVRYSPKKLDVIDLEQNQLITLPIEQLLQEVSAEFPGFGKVFSVVEGDMTRPAVPMLVDVSQDNLLPTFQGLLSSPFLRHMKNMLDILQERLGTPVDIEFAHDGQNFYLLQCRPQSYGPEASPAPIPVHVAPENVIFSANRHVTNGWVTGISHIVYVDPEGYASVGTRSEMLEVGRAIGRLDQMLPRRGFILMGPGRWGSRGDIKLGVNVTYVDISNTAMLIEIARREGNYVPELSFGTHFFQDLVESGIRYLPLYPDEPNTIFNERYLRRSPNLLADLLPDYAHLEKVLRVIDVTAAEGRSLHVLMNADLGEAMGLLVAADDTSGPRPDLEVSSRKQPPQFWRWRLRMAERIAADIDPERFGVKAVYVFGSTKNATASPGSDIDLLVHVTGDANKQQLLSNWLEGWSRCLADLNYLNTGYAATELLDVHYVTDEQVARREGFAAKIDAVTDAARPLPLGTSK